MKTIKIEGLTHKMKNRIRVHGDTWIVEKADLRRLQIMPVGDVGKPYPYSVWVEGGLEIKILEEK